MAELTDTQTAWLRAELGNRLTDDELQERYDRLGSIRDVALEALRERRTELLDAPLSVSVDGVASTNSAENVKAIERRLDAILKLDDDPSDGTPGDDGAPIVVENRIERFQLVRARRR